MRYAAFIFLIGLIACHDIWAMEKFCPVGVYSEENGYSSDPRKVAQFWLEPIERLYTAIPVLSPREEQWLDDELKQGDMNRYSRALQGTEYTIRSVRDDVRSLLASLRLLTGKIKSTSKESPAEQWRFFTYTLIDYDAAVRLTKLVAKKVIERKSMPEAWSFFEGDGFRLDESIRASRMNLARHILICILPQVD